MTISFKVCQIKEEDVNMENIKPFNINEFIGVEVDNLIKKEGFDYKGIWKKYEKQGLKEEDIYDRVSKERNKFDHVKFEKERKELVKENIKKAKVLQSSFKNDKESEDYCLGSNSFVNSAMKAYNQHHHLEIRPENIWMAIIVQFSFYVNKNSKLLRDRFVDFQGKKTLEISTGFPILEAPFDKLTIEMTKQIQKNIKDPSIKDWVVPNFSTTTETDKVIFSVALLSTMKNYFEYSFQTMCGLPQVTLHGTVSDWTDLKERVQRLIEFDNNENHMSKWIAHLLPIMDNFIQSANGSPDIEWWNKIVDYYRQSGSNVLSGWLSAFCVFDDKGEYHDNAILMSQKIPGDFPKIYTTSFANGYLSVPVLLKDFDGTEYKSQLYAGHFTSKIEKSKITPSLDWLMIANIS